MDQPWIHPGSCARACRQPSAPSIECARTRGADLGECARTTVAIIRNCALPVATFTFRGPPRRHLPDSGPTISLPCLLYISSKVNPGLILHTVNPSVVKLWDYVRNKNIFLHWHNAGLMLAHRLRRWPNITPALCQCPVFAG